MLITCIIWGKLAYLWGGHTSLIGVGCVTDILTGYVIDFEIMSKICMVYNTAEFAIWYNVHNHVCEFNHCGPAISLEMRVTSIAWKCSLDYGFWYTTLLSDGDGDAKIFTHLWEQHTHIYIWKKCNTEKTKAKD